MSRPSMRIRRFVAALLTALIGVLSAGVAPARADLVLDLTPTKIIVQQWNSTDPGPLATVLALGGTLTRQLPIIGGFAATVPASAIPTIASLSGVRVVSPDALVLPQEMPPSDGGPRSVYGSAIGASSVRQAGNQGQGVTVAVIDTGVASVPDLANRIVSIPLDPFGLLTAPCMNFSTELGCQDSYGHGTFVAGLIAGSGTSSSGTYVGVAPQAKILSVKLSGRDGTSSVSQLLGAIQWVVQNKDRFGIRVLNLSLRVDSNLSYRLDPVNFAVEQAWAKGITVVVAAGNEGPGPQTVTKPADDPWVISVGATDDAGTAPLGDDTVVSFSSRGPTPQGVVKPDVVAPGDHLISLRSPNSQADALYPNFVGSSYRRGSGTSFSAPIVSGAAALYLSANPTATNDRVKYALTATAHPLAGATTADQGAGVIDVAAALLAGPGAANQDLFQPVLFPNGTPSADDLVGVDTSGSNWSGSNWSGSNWSGSNWSEFDWLGSNWSGSNWSGSNWSGSNWSGSNWSGSNWSSQYWS